MRNQRWLLFGHIGQQTRIVFGGDAARVERNPYAKFRRNSSTGYGGDAITGKIQDGRQQPCLSSERNRNRRCTMRPLGKLFKISFEKFRHGLGGDAITRKWTPEYHLRPPPPCDKLYKFYMYSYYTVYIVSIFTMIFTTCFSANKYFIFLV